MAWPERFLIGRFTRNVGKGEAVRQGLLQAFEANAAADFAPALAHAKKIKSSAIRVTDHPRLSTRFYSNE